MEGERAWGPPHNPWVALDVTTDRVAHSGVSRRAHEGGLAEGRRFSHVRELVLRSWERSIGAGVAPDQAGAPVRLTSDELEEARQRSPLTRRLASCTRRFPAWMRMRDTLSRSVTR